MVAPNQVCLVDYIFILVLTGGDYTLKVVDDAPIWESVVTSNLSLHPELNRRIDKAAAVMAKLSKRV